MASFYQSDFSDIEQKMRDAFPAVVEKFIADAQEYSAAESKNISATFYKIVKVQLNLLPNDVVDAIHKYARLELSAVLYDILKYCTVDSKDLYDSAPESEHLMPLLNKARANKRQCAFSAVVLFRYNRECVPATETHDAHERHYNLTEITRRLL